MAECFVPHQEADFTIQSDASCIIVVEKEGIYSRLSEDRFFDRIPCILVTGKGKFTTEVRFLEII